MKTARALVVLVLFGSLVASAAPQFYVVGQGGVFNADAGSTALGEASPFVVEPIKSGTKSFVDFAVGAEVTDWLAVEAGYVEFSSFRSQLFRYRPGIIFVGVPSAPVFFYDLSGVRLSPVVRVFSTDRFALKIMAGVVHQTGEVVRRDFPSANLVGVTYELDDFAFHGGIGASYKLFRGASLEGRVVYYDFGKPELDPNRITSINYSLGLSWRF